MTKIITVVGANGDLGLRVCRELLKQNVKVKAVIRNKSKALDLEKLRSQNPEITNPKNLEIHCVATIRVIKKITQKSLLQT